MRGMVRGAATSALLLAGAVAGLHAQFGGGANWNTTSADAQRTGWIRTETRISAAALQRPQAGGFQLLWKVKPDNQARGSHTLTQPLVLGNLISHKGFKALAFVGGSSDVVFAYDYDLARIYWTQKLNTGITQPTNGPCVAALTALTRQVPLNQSAVPVPGAAPARGGGFPAARGGGPAPVPGAIPQFEQPLGNNVWAISSGGMLHVLNPHVGQDARRPIRFVPSGARVTGSVLVGNMLYATTQDGCGGAPNAVWALDVTDVTTNPTPKSWETGGAAIAGSVGQAVGLNNVVYVATGAGQGTYANSLVALDPVTLAVKSWYSATSPFVSSPVAFNAGGRDLVAAATGDGRLHILDGAAPGGADHRAALATATLPSGPDFKPGAVSTWQDPAGTRWVLLATGRSVVALRVNATAGGVTLEPGWTSRDLVAPATPIVLNDVVFALSSRPGVLYALDGRTGRELWNSGRSITAAVQGVGPSGQDGQAYVVAGDGTLYAFGLPLEH